LAHVQRKGEYQRTPFPLNFAREDIKLLGKRPPSEEIDVASFPGSPPHKRNAMEWGRNNFNFIPWYLFLLQNTDQKYTTCCS